MIYTMQYINRYVYTHIHRLIYLCISYSIYTHVRDVKIKSRIGGSTSWILPGVWSWRLGNCQDGLAGAPEAQGPFSRSLVECEMRSCWEDKILCNFLVKATKPAKECIFDEGASLGGIWDACLRGDGEGA